MAEQEQHDREGQREESPIDSFSLLFLTLPWE